MKKSWYGTQVTSCKWSELNEWMDSRCEKPQGFPPHFLCISSHSEQIRIDELYELRAFKDS